MRGQTEVSPYCLWSLIVWPNMCEDWGQFRLSPHSPNEVEVVLRRRFPVGSTTSGTKHATSSLVEKWILRIKNYWPSAFLIALGIVLAATANVVKDIVQARDVIWPKKSDALLLADQTAKSDFSRQL